LNSKLKTKSGFIIWFTLLILSVLLATFIPYGILGTLDPSLAVFGFWLGFGVVIIGLIVWGVKDWRNGQ